MLTDRFGRVHDYLRISLTDKCNLRCNYCMPENPCFLPKSSLLSDREVLQIARIFVEDFNIQKIRLTGGEPLLRKNLLGIITPLSKMPIKLAITTNGVLLDRYMEDLESLGIKSLNISLDSLHADRYNSITGSGHFNKVVENIRKALAKGFYLKINVVIKQGMNDDEILNFVSWTRGENVHVRFIEFMPFSGNAWASQEVVPYLKILDPIKRAYSFHKLKDDKGSTARAFQINGFKGTFAIISSVSHPFCSACNRIRLTADGKLISCLFSKDEFDLLSPMRKGRDIRPIIEHAISTKYAERGGLTEFSTMTVSDKLGRTMTAIGG